MLTSLGLVLTSARHVHTSLACPMLNVVRKYGVKQKVVFSGFEWESEHLRLWFKFKLGGGGGGGG